MILLHCTNNLQAIFFSMFKLRLLKPVFIIQGTDKSEWIIIYKRLDNSRSSVRIVSQNSCHHDSNRAMARSNAMQLGLQLIYTF
jgi:hypothetical protein